MNRDVAELEERVQQWTRSRSALSAEMRATAIALQNSEVFPRTELDHSLEDYREQFESIRNDLGLTSSAVAPASRSAGDEFRDRLSVCRWAEEATQRLNAVAHLSVPVGCESMLDPVLAARNEATERITRAPWEESELIHEVREGRHPLCRLVVLVDALEQLTDDEWTTAMAEVQQSFGSQISTAIARGKVSLTESASPLLD